MTDSFIITKILQSLLLPPSILIILIGLGFILTNKRPHLGKGIILVCLILFYLLSIEPVANALIRPLESSFQPVKGVSLNSSNTIVILTGGVRDLSWLGNKPEPTEGSLSRLIYGTILYKQAPGASIVISGGSGEPGKPDISEANAMKEIAISLGVPLEDIIVERDSRNTIESAAAIKKLAGEKRILLVTSAYHMKRAVAMFRKVGMDVIPAPTDFISEQRGASLYSFIPSAGSFHISTIAFSEYLSFTWYGLTGQL